MNPTRPNSITREKFLELLSAYKGKFSLRHTLLRAPGGYCPLAVVFGGTDSYLLGYGIFADNLFDQTSITARDVMNAADDYPNKDTQELRRDMRAVLGL